MALPTRSLQNFIRLIGSRQFLRVMSSESNAGVKVESKELNNAEDLEKMKKLCPAVAQYGPYNISGELQPGQLRKWCTCGLSKKQPWCDGAHKGTGFRSLKFIVGEKYQTFHSLCGCKHTKSPPYCDGSHIKIPSMIKERQDNCTSSHEKEDMKLCTGCGWVPKW